MKATTVNPLLLSPRRGGGGGGGGTYFFQARLSEGLMEVGGLNCTRLP